MEKRIQAAFFALGLCLALCACAPVVVKPSPLEELQTDSADTTPDPGTYKIGAGDEIEVKFFFTPELNDRVQVRPDGRISVMFAQDIKAAGKTPEQLGAAIRKKLARHLKQSDVVVIVRTFASQRAYVGGEVAKPGPVQLNGKEHLTQVLTEAGWVTPTARMNEIVLVRRGEDGKESVYPLNLSKYISGEDMTQNVMIEPGDLVMVPPSDATNFDRWVDRNIRQALPISSEFVVNHGVGPR